MKQISILIPTRGRPAFMYRVTESALNFAFDATNIQTIFYIDEDDTASINAVKDIKKFQDKFFGEDTVKYIVGPRILLSQMWNECYKLADAKIIMHGGDDIIFRTEDWDLEVYTAFLKYEDRILFAYGEDGHQVNTFGTHGFIHSNWIETVGYFVPPYFSSDYNDAWLNEVAEIIGRKQLLPILTEHMHPHAGKHIEDQTHIDRKKRGEQDGVTDKYNSLAQERINDAKKLQTFIDNYKSKQK